MKKIFTLVAVAAMAMTASAQTWDFSVLPTQACDGTGNLSCNLTDTEGKISEDPNKWSAFQNKGGIKDGEELTVKEGEKFEPAAGLSWGILDNDKMILFRHYPAEYGGMHLYFNKEVDVTIPAKAGQIIEVVACSGKNDKEVVGTGIAEGFTILYSKEFQYSTYSCTVTEDNPVLKIKSAVYVQKITVKKAPIPGLSWSATAGETIPNPDDDTKTVTLGSFTGEASPAAAFSAFDMTVEGANTGNGYVRFTNGYKGGNTGVDFVAYYPAVSKEAVTVTFTGTIAEGVTFKPTKVAFNAARVGTDGGTMDVKFVADDAETVLVEGMIPARNNKETADDTKKDEEKFCAGRFEAAVSGDITKSVKLVIVCNGLADNKQYAIGDVQIVGTTEGGSTGINEMKTVRMANDVMFNLAGQKVGKEYKGIVIVNGKKMIQK